MQHEIEFDDEQGSLEQEGARPAGVRSHPGRGHHPDRSPGQRRSGRPVGHQPVGLRPRADRHGHRHPGENIQLDEDFRATRHAIAGDGKWTITYTIPGTDTTSKSYTIEQLNGLNQDGQVTITAAPEAQPADFAVTSPANNSDVSSRTVTFTGTGRQGDTINLLDTQDNRLTGPVVVGADQTWSATITFPNTAARSQAVRVTDVRGASGAGDTTVNITLPAVAPADQFSLTSPKSGSTVDSRTVTFTGTGTPGDLVNTLDADGNRVAPQVLVAADGTWTTTGTFSDSAAVVQNLSVNQIGGAQGQGEVNFTINLPAVTTPPAATPLTLITPKDGSTVDSRTVTFSGKGTPGDAIAVVNAEGDVVAPATIVEADGTWTTTGTFSDSAARTQDLTVGEVDSNLDVVDTIDFTITLPAVSTGTGTTTPGAGTGTTTPGAATGTGARPTGSLPVVAG